MSLVEFDVPKSSLYTAGTDSWQQIAGPESFWDRLNQSKGVPAITEMPNVWNIKIVGGK